MVTSKKIRISKDIALLWSITTNGEVLPLMGRDLQLVLYDPFGRAIALPFAIDGNVISATFMGRDQKALGKYTLTLYENKDKGGATVVDSVDAFCLVARTSCEDGATPDNLESITVELTGDLVLGIRGMSAYDVWLTMGNEGTIEDYLASLKGEKGDSLYQQMVNAGRFEGTEEEFLQQYQDAVNAANNGAERAENAADDAATLMSQLIVSEQKREESEALRKESEVERQTSEQERKEAEERRKADEIERIEAENVRQANEVERQTSESSRIESETQRQEAEQERRDWFNSAVVQTEGQSTTAVMSQKSVTDALALKFDKSAIVLLTETEYDALVASGTVDQEKLYLITESDD